jgi:arylsulfatase A-like enzyme
MVMAASLAVPVTPARAQEIPPNIVIFLSDDAGFGTLRPDAMPNVWTGLVERGVRFSRFYSPNPTCCPARASLLTGLLSARTQVWTNGEGSSTTTDPWIRYGGTAAFHAVDGNERATLAYVLDRQGYETGLFGKYLNGYASYAATRSPDDPAAWRPAGWDSWHVFFGDNGAYDDYVLNVDGMLRSYGSDASEHSTTVLGRHAVAWLRSIPEGAPFFLLYAPFAPHNPTIADSRDEGRFAGLPDFRSPALNEEDVSDKPSYIGRLRTLASWKMSRKRRDTFEAVYSMDRQIGRIMDAIEERGETDRTIFLYLSDNGLGWGEHRWRFKLVPYERSSRVPAVMRFDGVLPPGSLYADLASIVDVKATVLSLAGMSWSGPSDGIDLFSGRRRWVLLSSMHHPRRDPGVPSYCGIVTARWKYVVHVPQPDGSGLVEGPYEEELYDLGRDPYELDNRLRVRTGDRVLRARDRLRSRLADQGWCGFPPDSVQPNWPSS